MEYFVDGWYKVKGGYAAIDLAKTTFFFTKNKPSEVIKKRDMVTRSINYIIEESEQIFRVVDTQENFVSYLMNIGNVIIGEEEDEFNDIIFEVENNKCALRAVKDDLKDFVEFTSETNCLENEVCKFNTMLILNALEDLKGETIVISLEKMFLSNTIIKIKDVDTQNYIVVLPKVDN